MACSGNLISWAWEPTLSSFRLLMELRLGGRGPGLQRTSLTFSKLLPSLALNSLSDKRLRKPSVPLPAFLAVVRNLSVY